MRIRLRDGGISLLQINFLIILVSGDTLSFPSTSKIAGRHFGSSEKFTVPTSDNTRLIILLETILFGNN